MKKYLLKSFALLAMLFSAITMSAKQYCGDVMKSNTGWDGNYTLSVEKVSDTQSRLTITVADSETITGFYQFLIQDQGGGTASKQNFDPGDTDFSNAELFSVAADGKSAVINVNWTTYPTSDVQIHLILRRNNSAGGSDIFGNTLYDVDFSAACDGSGEGGGDTGIPVLESVELFGAAQNFVLLTPTATDNKGVTSYLITPNGGAEKEVTLDNAGKIKIEGLTLDKSYTYSVKAKDADGNVSNAKEITFSTLDNVFCEEEVLPGTAQEFANQKLTFTAKKVSDTETYFAISSSTSTLTKISTVTFYSNTGETGTYGGGVLPDGYVLKDGWTLTDNTLSKTVTWTTYPTAPFRGSINAIRNKNSDTEKTTINWMYTMDLSNTCGEEPTPEPEETIIVETYFAPNWTVDPTSSATYDPNTGTITVDIKNALSSQWQGQVKVKHDVAFSADKQYTLSCKFHATAAVGGVTIKMDDNQDNPVLIENASLSLPANEDYIYTSAPSNGKAGNNQILVFDFGWAPPCQITISDIVIQEVESTTPDEPAEPEVVESNYCQKLLTSGDKSINLSCEKIADGNYRVTIEGDNLSNISEGTWLYKNKNNHGDGNFQLVSTITSSTATKIVCEFEAIDPVFYTPLYVIMPSEVNFGTIDNIVWGTCPEPEVSVLTTLTATAASSICKVGETVAISTVAKDQNGKTMANAGEVTYTITPIDAGTITDNVYTPAKIGSATIVAAIGEVKAAAFDVFAYDGENVALSPDINNSKIVTQSDFAPNGTDAWHAIDGNEGSVWQGSATNGTADDEAARTFDAWFVVDFGAYYDINLVSINFEGACSQEYHVDFSADNATWNQAYNYVGTANTNAHTQLIYGNDLQNSTKVRYARFYSTKAATKWGMKIYEFKVFGTPFVASGDTEKPVMGTATLVSKTHKSAIIAVSATDNDEVGSYHVVCTNPAYEQTLTPTEGQITLTDLTAATAYKFTITAIDLAGNESENAATVECTTNPYNAKPTSAPTPPTHDAKQVKSVFSDVYGGTFSAMEGWGQATQFEELHFNGDYVRYYTNFNYLGWATGSPINASAMEKLHLDIWAAEDATIMIVPIYGGQGLVTDDKKTKTVTVKGQEWNSIDLTLATDFAGLNLSSIFQFKFDAPQGTDKFAIDNVYFYTTQIADDETPPTNLIATAVPSFTTAVINCQATDESGSISYEVYLGSELKGTGSADSGATASITVTNLQPNREFTMTVIATDVYGNESAETVDVTFTTLSYPAPAPTPTWDATKVFSIYSDAYTTTVTRAFGWGWGASTVEAQVELAAGDNALQYTTSNYAGWELNGNNTIGDLNEYPYLHMDIYVENDGSIQFTPIWGAEALKEYTLQAGWNSLDINLVAEFTGIKLENIYQLKWAAMPATCFIDNVYFFDGLIEGVVIDDDSDLTQLRDGFIYNLTLKRNFVMDEDWNTLCLPFALTEEQVVDIFGEGTTLVKLQESKLLSATEIELEFVPVTYIEASTPYLIKPAQNVGAGVALEGVVINLTPNVIETDDANMIPVLKAQSFTGENNTFYLGANENLYPRPTSREIKAMRAYFQFPNLTAAQASKLRARVVVEENVETALDNVSGQKQENIKVISNGQLIIIHDGGKYNAQGVKISE